MKRYDSYKDSGIEWIGVIPSHWRKSKFKFVSNLYTGNSLNDSQKLQYESKNLDEIPYVSSKDIDVEFKTVNYNNGLRIPKDNNLLKTSPKGSFLMVIEGGSSGKKIVFLKQKVCFVNKLCSFNSTENNKFLYYFVQSSNYQDKFKLSMSGLIGGVSVSNLKNFELPLPPINEQKQIVSFLDNKNSSIEFQIRKSQKKIELLREQRTSIINEVVTKGLNSKVEMKDYGEEYNGKIPSHWKIKPLKYLLSYTKGFAFKSEVFCDEGIPIVKASDIKQGTIKSPNVFLDPKRLDSYQKVILKTGDIVISTVGSQYSVPGSAVGQLAIVPENLDGSLLNQNTIFVRLKTEFITRQFLFYSLLSRQFRSHLDIYSHGTANQASLNVEDILNYKIILPEIREQKKIVESLQRDLSKIDKLMNFETKKVDLLKEYRLSLFSSIVTGKVKVSEDII